MSAKILLADDSITIQKVVELTFADEGYEVDAVGDGAAAIEKLKENPDIVLCDVIIPEKNGYEVCKYIKDSEEFAHIPVILLKGAFEAFDEEKARECRADDSLTKPFESQELLQRVQFLLTTKQASPEGKTEVYVSADEAFKDLALDDNTPTDTSMEGGVFESFDEETASETYSPDEKEQLFEEESDDRGEATPDEETWEEATTTPEPAFEPVEQDQPPAETTEPSQEEYETHAPESDASAPSFTGDDPSLASDAVKGLAQGTVTEISREIIEEVAWEVVPEMAELIIKQRIRELEQKAEEESS